MWSPIDSRNYNIYLMRKVDIDNNDEKKIYSFALKINVFLTEALINCLQNGNISKKIKEPINLIQIIYFLLNLMQPNNWK